MPSKEREALQRKVAEILDHPSVFMGGPSQQNMRRADKILFTILAALQEPTEGMIEATGSYYIEDKNRDLVVWNSMLAASALGEQSE